MTRPFIVRADTIDLQDHNAPSAKDHSHNRLVDDGTTAPHQASTLREVAHKAAEDESRSPRLSWASGNEPSAQEDLADSVQRRMQQEQQEDQLAIAQNGGASSSDEGEDDGDMDDDMMDRISSSPSIDDEDIDFEFVYALHTFVATVEGQANATKGDTMVLLDDSNSYWWLVRIVKDSSIGYLPAEHIETPTERLARRNKYRNVDLSATMLSDNAPKQKTSFKSIRMRRKTVTFTDPTYVDYSEIEYSSDEEDIEELFGQDVAIQQQADQQKQQKSEKVDEDVITEDSAKVEPLKTRAASDAVVDPARQETAEEESRDSEETDAWPNGVKKTRNGTVRNTDSFFKDDTVETKKISLTPNLLKDDSASRPSTDSTGSKSRVSLESKMEKELVADKDKKGKKDKKPSAIRSFFSRKDKKRATDDDDESFGKRSMDIISEPRESEDPITEEQRQPSPDKSALGRSPSKLQKQQPKTEASLGRSNSKQKKPQDLATQLSESRTNDVSNVPPASMRIVDPETNEAKDVLSSQLYHQQDPGTGKLGLSPAALSKDAASNTAARSQQTVQAAVRMELDESDCDEAEALLESPETTPEPRTEKQADDKPLRPHLPGAFPDSFQTVSTVASDQTVRPAEQQRDRLSESPVQVSPPQFGNTQTLPDLMADMANEASSPEASPSPDFAAVEEPSKDKDKAQWDDTKLRAFFDEGDHVRDLLAVVYDTSDVDPADSGVSGLFREQNARLAEITTQLDNMLGDWLARKQRLRGTL